MRSLRKVFTLLLAVVYLGVVLFFQMLHGHSQGEEFKSFHFVNPEYSIKKAPEAQDNTGCLVCHLMHEHYAVLPDVLSVDFAELHNYFILNCRAQLVYLYKDKEVSTLRGPPSA